MQDTKESTYELDFDILISIEPDTDEIIYYSEFYQKKMVMNHFAWFKDVDNTKNFEEYCKLRHLNFEDVPFTIEGKKCKMPHKTFQYEAIGKIIHIPDINDICQYLNKRGIYLKDMTQNEFQNYLGDYFMFPLFEIEKAKEKELIEIEKEKEHEKLFEEIFIEESRLSLRNDGIVLYIEGFAKYLKSYGRNTENLTGEEFREVVKDYYFLKLHERNGSIAPLPKAEEQENRVLSKREQTTIDNYREYVNFYCRNIKELNSNPIKAKRDTTKKFDISTKTLERAFQNNKDILDTYQIII